MATAGSTKGRARFAAACGVLSRYVKQQAAAETTEARSVALPLLPGADLTQKEQQPAAQMTIFYGGRVLVLVLDDVPADKAAGLLQLAGRRCGAGAGSKDGGGEKGVAAAVHGKA
jgi:jasmonate ZIM domain-containing protein